MKSINWMGNDPQLAVAVLTIEEDGIVEDRILILDTLNTADRPAALGYFVLDTLRAYYGQHGHFPCAHLRLGTASTIALEQRARKGRIKGGRKDGNWSTYATKLHDGEFGELFRLVTAVEHGDEDLLRG